MTPNSILGVKEFSKLYHISTKNARGCVDFFIVIMKFDNSIIIRCHIHNLPSQYLYVWERELHKFRPIIYICSPYSGDIANNIIQARRYSKFAVDEGFLPITPHLLYTQFMNDSNPDEREIGMQMGLVLLTKCCEVWVFGERISSGMQREIRKAQNRGVQIRYFNEECQEVMK